MGLLYPIPRLLFILIVLIDYAPAVGALANLIRACALA